MTTNRSLDWLVDAVVNAVTAYDASGDHRHAGSPVPGDCIRCDIIATLPPYARARIDAATITTYATTRVPHASYLKAHSEAGATSEPLSPADRAALLTDGAR
jgi:hypothetical protein